MTSLSSKAIPYVVLGITFGLALYEVVTGRNVNLELLVPILAPMGIAGAAKSAIESIAAHKATAKEIIKEHGVQ